MYRQKFKSILIELIIDLDHQYERIEKDIKQSENLSMYALKNLWKQYPQKIIFLSYNKQELKEEFLSQMQSLKDTIHSHKTNLNTKIQSINNSDMILDLRNQDIQNTILFIETLRFFQTYPQQSKSKKELIPIIRSFKAEYIFACYSTCSSKEGLEEIIIGQWKERRIRQYIHAFEQIRTEDKYYSMKHNITRLAEITETWKEKMIVCSNIEQQWLSISEKIKNLFSNQILDLDRSISLIKQLLSFDAKIKNFIDSTLDEILNEIIKIGRTMTYNPYPWCADRVLRYPWKKTRTAIKKELEKNNSLFISRWDEEEANIQLHHTFLQNNLIKTPYSITISSQIFEISSYIDEISRYLYNVLSSVHLHRYLICATLADQSYQSHEYSSDEEYNGNNFIRLFSNKSSNKLYFAIQNKAYSKAYSYSWKSYSIKELKYTTYKKHKRAINFFNKINIDDFSENEINYINDHTDENKSILYNLLQSSKWQTKKQKMLEKMMSYYNPDKAYYTIIESITNEADDIDIIFSINENKPRITLKYIDPTEKRTKEEIINIETSTDTILPSSKNNTQLVIHFFLQFLIYNTIQFRVVKRPDSNNEIKYELIPIGLQNHDQ